MNIESTMNPILCCPVCNAKKTTIWASATDAEYLTVNETFQFYRCEECLILFINPVPQDKLHIIYPTNYYSFISPKPSFIMKIKNWLDKKLFKSILNEIPGQSLNILDIGGGAGWQLNTLRKVEDRIEKTCLVDLDPNAEAIARQNGHEYYCQRIEDFQPNQKFDLILLLNLIEHVSNPKQILEKLRTMLSKEGVAIVKTPNYEALDAKIFRHRDWAGFHCPRHWVLFNKDSFQNLVSLAGLQVKKFSYTQGAPFWAASILFYLAKLGLVKITRERPAPYHPLFGILSAFFALFDFMRRPFSKTSQMFFILSLKNQ